MRVCDVVNLESAVCLLMLARYSREVDMMLAESHHLALRLISVQQSIDVELPRC